MGSLISYVNYIDDSTITNNSDGSEVLTDENVKVRQLGKVFRQSLTLTSPLESVILDFDLDSAQSISYVGILGHNISSGTYSVSLGTSLGASDVATASGTLWQGVADDPKQQHVILPATYSARYVRVALTPADGKSVEIGRVWVDDPWSPAVGIDFSHTVQDVSVSNRSIGGSKYTYSKPRFRQMNVKLLHMSEADALGSSSDNTTRSAHHMDMTAGTSSSMVIIPETTGADPAQVIHKLGFYGSIKTSTAINLVPAKSGSGWVYDKSFQFEEER